MFEKSISDEAALFPLEPAHAEEYFALIDVNRQRLRRWFLWVDETTNPNDTREFVKNARRRWAEHGDVTAGIRFQGRMAGFIGLHDIYARHGTASIGYWLGEEFEGRGLVTLGCKALLDHAFRTLHLNRVELQIESSNERSKAVALRLGFQYEGTLRQVARGSDGYEDHEVYSILRDEWAG